MKLMEMSLIMEKINDILGYSNLKIFQDDDCFSFSLDSIVLANYSNIRFNDKYIADYCTGNGVVPIILSRRTNSKIIGIEIQEKLYNLADKSITYNKLNNQITVCNEDIKVYSKHNINVFDHILCNPPYFKYSKDSLLKLSEEKAIARHEIKLNLSDLCYSVKISLKDGGLFSLVYPVDRFVEVIECLKINNLEPKRIKFVYNKLNSNPSLFFIESQKNAKSGVIVEPPLVLCNDDNSFTDEYKRLQEVICDGTKEF